MTDDDLGFDPADTELARRLGAAAPAAGDTDAVLAGLRPRLDPGPTPAPGRDGGHRHGRDGGPGRSGVRGRRPGQRLEGPGAARDPPAVDARDRPRADHSDRPDHADHHARRSIVDPIPDLAGERSHRSHHSAQHRAQFAADDGRRPRRQPRPGRLRIRRLGVGLELGLRVALLRILGRFGLRGRLEQRLERAVKRA